MNRAIDKKRSEIETRVGTETTEDKDLINLHELETNLVYFATSLSSNKVVLDGLTRYERIKQYPEDKELLEGLFWKFLEYIHNLQQLKHFTPF